MKSLWLVVLWVLCSPVVWAQEKERLALTVHYDKGDPGEERDVWTADFFVDESDRLRRVRIVTDSPFVGEPSTTVDRKLTWEGDTVSFGDYADGKSVGWQAQLSRAGEGEIRLSRRFEVGGSPVLSSIRFLDAKKSSWEEGSYLSSWSLDSGFSRIASARGQRSGRTLLSVETKGARLATNRDGRLYSFVILDKKPSALLGTFYDSYLEANDWIPIGQVSLTGPGLWNQDPLVRLIHGYVLDGLLLDPVWAPLVFEKEYLK